MTVRIYLPQVEVSNLFAFLSLTVSRGVLFFFFQAEDGIRDLTVTGVQTCALPIYRSRAPVRVVRALRRALPPAPRKETRARRSQSSRARDRTSCRAPRSCAASKIGRASCRERV